MTSQHIKSVGIVGAGFSGTMLAVHLTEMSSRPLQVLLFDKNASFAKGPAYATPNAKHLLNVRVANMSAYNEDPGHFVRWLSTDRQHRADPQSDHTFVSRGTYGRYLRTTLESACVSAKSGAHVIEVAAEVTDLEVDDRFIRLTAADGRSFEVECVALCIGNFPAALPPVANSSSSEAVHYIAAPWNAHALDRIGPHDSVAIIGTSLTMVDVVLDLRSRGHKGPVTALSRRGFLPVSHRDVDPYEPFLAGDSLPKTIRLLLRRVRDEIEAAARRGVDWRSVIDALRPHTQALWRNLPLEERRRFLRHVRPYWEVHRHRVAPVIAGEIDALCRSGALSITAGRILSLTFKSGRFDLVVRHKNDGAARPLSADWLINCSGPQLDYERACDPLVRSLFASGLARPDALQLGLDVTDDYRLIGVAATAAEPLFALGPPIRGALWETTAVPDIRKQCEALARYIIRQHFRKDELAVSG